MKLPRTNSQPVMILAGGTGGHIFPGIAVAQALRQRQVPVLWLGSVGGMETRLVPAAGLPIETIVVRALRGKGALRLLLAPLAMLRALAQALRVMARTKPRAVISFGGFAAGPGGIAAWLLRRPLLVHEQNRAPGLTNRILVRVASDILCGFPDAFPGRPSQWLGNPVRAAIAAVSPPEQRLRDRGPALRVLVIGGSQGARVLNTAVPDALARLPGGCSRPSLGCAALGLPPGAATLRIRHQCGTAMYDATRKSYADAGIAASVEPFIEDMAAAYAWADLVVCRAGALTLAELCAVGVPSVLVPFAQAVDDHQTRNAEFLRDRGAALLLPEGPDLAQRLTAAVARLHGDADERLRMAQAARSLARVDAAERVADAILARSLGASA